MDGEQRNVKQKWTLGDPPLGRRSSSFSVASLFRVMTIIGFAFGWCFALPIRHAMLPLIIIGMAAALAAVVGYRRCAPTRRRLFAAICFFGNGCVVSLFTAMVGVVIQRTPEAAFVELLVVIASFPGVVIVSFCMFRSWVWAANDQSSNFG